MFRKLLILGVCAGASAAVPAFFQSDPDALMRTVRGMLSSEPDAPEEQPGPAPASLERPAAGRTVAIPADANGHFRAEFRINGQRVTGMVDTGATLVALNESTARRVGVRLAAADFSHEVRTANGTTRAALTRLSAVAIGRIQLRDVDAVVLDDRALSGTLVGLSFLKRLDGYTVEDGSLNLKQ